MQCSHGCGEDGGPAGALGLAYCDTCNTDSCLVGPDGVCGKGANMDPRQAGPMHNPIPKDPPMGLAEFLDEIGADEWEASPLGDLICPCGDTIELDGRCPEGHESPLMGMGV